MPISKPPISKKPAGEWKDRYLRLSCPACGADNHIIVTFDGPQSQTDEVGLCHACGAPVHSERCFMIWVGRSRVEVERRVARAAGLARVL